jgi:hypothetical protein
MQRQPQLTQEGGCLTLQKGNNYYYVLTKDLYVSKKKYWLIKGTMFKCVKTRTFMTRTIFFEITPSFRVGSDGDRQWTQYKAKKTKVQLTAAESVGLQFKKGCADCWAVQQGHFPSKKCEIVTVPIELELLRCCYVECPIDELDELRRLPK